ncbi:MAG: pyridoxine 5'-phosphate synthase [Syntrophobacterales bacterium]
MAKLAVNVDHVATLREARRTAEPDPVTAAALAELAGAQGIAVHLREDRRHIQDRDLHLLRQTVKTKLNLEMAATQEMLKTALSVKPDMVTLVPERREELTTEGGLEVQLNRDNLKKYVRLFKDADIIVSLVINPDLDQIKAAQWVEADYIEVHAGSFCEARTLTERQEEFDRIQNAVKMAHKVGLGVTVGHRLDHSNIGWLVDVAEIEEFIIGHAIVARAVLVGFERAVREMVELINWGAGWRRTGP